MESHFSSVSHFPRVCRFGGLLLVFLFLAGATAACSGDDEAQKTDQGSFDDKPSNKKPRARYGNLDRSDLSPTGFDLNGDGRDDQIHFKSGGELVRVHRDLNFDGVPDSYEYYQNGALVEEEFDLDLDGMIDVIHFVKGGTVTQKQYAVGFKADMTIARHYDSQGNLVRIERDTNKDSRADQWEYFSPGADKPNKIETDTDYDGKPDESTSSGGVPDDGA